MSWDVGWAYRDFFHYGYLVPILNGLLFKYLVGRDNE